MNFTRCFIIRDLNCLGRVGRRRNILFATEFSFAARGESEDKKSKKCKVFQIRLLRGDDSSLLQCKGWFFPERSWWLGVATVRTATKTYLCLTMRRKL